MTTTEKHTNFKNKIDKSILYKFNSGAERSIFVEIYQWFGEKKKPSRWIYDPQVKLIGFGNEKVIFFFSKDRLLQMCSVMPHIRQHICASSTTEVEALVLSNERARHFADFILEM
jgi:hypothetical protein